MYIVLSGLQIRVRLENCFLHFSSKTYVVGTQKNHLNETFFEHPKDMFIKMSKKEKYHFTLIKFPYLDLCNYQINQLYYVTDIYMARFYF